MIAVSCIPRPARVLLSRRTLVIAALLAVLLGPSLSESSAYESSPGPSAIDALIQQGEKLTGSNEIQGCCHSNFGWSVALSADGNTALIGGFDDNSGVGAAWVFTRSGSTWTQQGEKLTGSGEVGYGGFGYGVALSADGNTALIGGAGDNHYSGAAWVFTRSGSTWTQQGMELTAGGESGEGDFGFSVALSADGNTALIGGPNDNGYVGSAWVFTRSGSTWAQQGSKLEGAEESGRGGFGSHLALSADGNTALIGGDTDNSGVGAAWVFTRSGSTWTQQGEKLTGSGEVREGLFGSSVALSSDGNTALIGGYNDNDAVGAAWVFTRSGSSWTQQGSKLTGSGEAAFDEYYGGGFGGSVALSGDGNTALIGGAGDNGVGAVWLFKRSGSTWTQEGEKVTGAGEVGEGHFGSSVALSSDGNTALVGGVGDNSYVGAAWVFTSEPTSPEPGAGGSGISGGSTSSHEVIRQVVFVHGIRASCAKAGNGEYKALYDALAAQATSVYSFCYDHDIAFGEKSSGLTGSPQRCFSGSGRQVGSIASTADAGRERETSRHHIGPLYVSANTGAARESDDDDSALAYDAAKLDDCLGALVNYDIATYGHPLPTAVIGNSMGGAITRGWLALAESRNSRSLQGVTTVMLLEGATEGSWVARLGANVNQLASDLPSIPGIPSSAAGSTIATVLQEALERFALNPARAGVQDLAPQSAWYRSVAAAGAPPRLHYFSLSTDIHLHIAVHFLWMTVGHGETDFPGDGIMQLGSPAYNALPEWGGSQFLPFGDGPDQHQYVISPQWTVNTEVSSAGAWTFLGTVAAIYTSGEHASHFNFGQYMGMENGQGQFTGGLEVSSCANGQPIGVPEEITRVFADPANACSAAGPPVPVAALTQSLITQASPVAPGVLGSSSGLRPFVQQGMSPEHDYTTTPAIATSAATGIPRPAAIPEILRDRHGRCTLSIVFSGPLRGQLSVEIPGHGVFVARLHLPHRRLLVNLTIKAEHLDAPDHQTVRLTLRGHLGLASHSADLQIRVAPIGIRTGLLTGTPRYAHARATSKRLIAALEQNNFSELANMLAIPDTTPSTLAAELAREDIHITSIAPRGDGQPLWLPDGNPGWRQPVIARAAGQPTLHADLILEQQHNAWKLLGSATVR